jgi:hypothetical protein
MSGPGFLGLEFKDEALVYAVWGAYGYTLINDRVLESKPEELDIYHPWMTRYHIKDLPAFDDLLPVIIGHQVSEVSLRDELCIINTIKGGEKLKIELVKNDKRLAPNLKGKKEDAYKTGVIGNHIVIQKIEAMLWAR